jgi:hypothetical protein
MAKKDDIELEIAETVEEPQAEETSRKGEASQMEAAPEITLTETFKKIKENASEEDPKPSQQLKLRTILGGDMLSAEVVRSQIWLFVLIVIFTIAYVAFRYQCQQDLLTIDKKENELKDAKFKALSSSSELTERCRESRVLDMLKANNDSSLHQADQPPYIIQVPE